MELVFIRHGEGEHTLDIPSSLEITDPSLTANGIKQARLLRNQFPLTSKDTIIISPLRRTLETACIWSGNIDCRMIVSPLVSPRMFPIKPESNSSSCDKILNLEIIKLEFPTVEIDVTFSQDIRYEGINTLSDSNFIKLAKVFISQCKKLKQEKIYIVSHDGTITSYWQMISGQNLSRNDFLHETGWFQISC